MPIGASHMRETVNSVICGAGTWKPHQQKSRNLAAAVALTIPRDSSASAFMESKRGLTSSYPDNGGSNSIRMDIFSLPEDGVW